MQTKSINETLKTLAREIVGDCNTKSPNVFFLTNTKTGDVLALMVGNDLEDAAIKLAGEFQGPVMVEDRITGVVWENRASERLQEQEDAE